MKKTVYIHVSAWDRENVTIENTICDYNSYVFVAEREIEIADSLLPTQEQFEKLKLDQEIARAKRSVVDKGLDLEHAKENLKDLECRLTDASTETEQDFY